MHVPNSGRLHELLTPRREVFLLPALKSKTKRKTKYTLVMSRYGAGYVSIEAAKANDLFEEALNAGVISEFASHRVVQREKRIGLSRVDFFLEDTSGANTYLEVKSVTLVVNETAMFPDAPTKRGRKHLRELIGLREKGISAATAFIILRPDAKFFSPNDQEDPEYKEILKEAFKAGVKIIAYECRVNREEIYVTDPVPVIL